MKNEERSTLVPSRGSTSHRHSSQCRWHDACKKHASVRLFHSSVDASAAFFRELSAPCSPATWGGTLIRSGRRPSHAGSRSENSRGLSPILHGKLGLSPSPRRFSARLSDWPPLLP